MSKFDYRVGSVIRYRSFGGEFRTVKVDEKSADIKDGRPGFGGQTTVIDTKITGLSRLPASYFVSVSYMCWAYRRRKLTVKGDGEAVYD